MPDFLNPIFVLKTHWMFAYARKYAVRFVVAYLLYFIAATAFLSSLAEARPDELAEAVQGFAFFVFVVVAILGCSYAAAQMDALPKRYIENDLIHFTAMSEWSILLGYVYTGAFYAFVTCVCGTLVYLPCVIYLGTAWAFPIGHFFTILLISQMFTHLAAAFFAGVRTQYEFIFMGSSMYVVLPCLLWMPIYNFMSLSPMFDFYFYLFEKPTLYWGWAIFYTVPIALLGIHLARKNISPRTSIFRRWIRCLAGFIVLAIVMNLVVIFFS